jgi:nicotinate-nucleotide adenylyltransferase
MSTLIGVFGGTFNPIHLGHLSIAQQVAQALDFNQVRFIPAAQPPHKPAPKVSAQQRADMVQLAIQDYPNFVLDTTELARTGPSYTVDTLQQLKAQLPDQSFCLILGWDAFTNIHTWHEWQSLFTLAHIALVQRPQQEQTILPMAIKTEFDNRLRSLSDAKTLMRKQNAGLICQVPTNPLSISSTEIRQQLSLGQTPLGQLPSAVIDYINQHQLYQTRMFEK